MRLDKWLWQARFFKTRSLAARYVETSRCRVDGRLTDKPHAAVAPGMVLTFALGPRVRVIRIRALGERRGPASEARALYDEIDAS
jgi:ribosome-associated heat shock protein Hsp15